MNIRGSGGATCFGTMVMAVIAAPDRAAAADCPVGHEQLASTLKASVKASGGPSDGGFDSHQGRAW